MMLTKTALAILLCFSSAARADVDVALDTHVLPGVDRFADAATALAAADCTPDALRPAFSEATLAWAAIAHLTFGPAETDGRARTILFWPEERNATARGLRLLQEQGPDAWTPDAIARASAAARGLAGLERLIWEGDGKPCALTRAIANDLATMAMTIQDGWTGGFADLMRTAGAPGNRRFLVEDEVLGVLYTAFLTGLEFTADQRLGRPMGTFDNPRPARAQFHRSALSVPIVVSSLTALRDLAGALTDAPRTQAALTRAIAQAEALGDPGLQTVADPAGRFRVEALQTTVRDIIVIADTEIGGPLEFSVGFNSADGD